MVSIGSYTALGRTAARDYASATREQTRVSDQLGRTGPDFRNNAVTAGMTRKLESQVVAWDHAAKMNRLSLDKIDTLQSHNDFLYDIAIQARDIFAAAGDSSLTQKERDAARDNIFNLIFQSQKVSTDYNNYGQTVDAYTDGNGWVPLSTKSIISIYNVDATQTEYSNFKLGVSIPLYDSNWSYSASYFSDNIGSFQAAFDQLLTGGRAEPEDTPYGFKNTYESGGQSFIGAQAAALKVAQSFAEKMSDTLSIGIDRLNAIDYETQSHYLAQVQAQKDQSLSGMSIANQAQQAYVQALQRTNQSVGQLVKFYA
jgi:hypothetical protein